MDMRHKGVVRKDNTALGEINNFFKHPAFFQSLHFMHARLSFIVFFSYYSVRKYKVKKTTGDNGLVKVKQRQSLVVL